MPAPFVDQGEMYLSQSTESQKSHNRPKVTFSPVPFVLEQFSRCCLPCPCRDRPAAKSFLRSQSPFDHTIRETTTKILNHLLAKGKPN